ncbi:hypothetical protein Tco_0238402 [Tanacetum coccineum]
MNFASCDSSDKSSLRKSVESSIFSPRVAESESNLKTAAQEDISFNNNTPYVSSVKDDKHSRPAPVHADRPFPASRRNFISVSAGWRNNAARPMDSGELLLSPQQVVLGETVDHICKGDPRTMENPFKNKDLGIVDSGCSRSMSGNKERLDDFVEIKGGTITFGGGEGRITGKGTIRTSKLDFENVYYVKELQHFNLFSV